MVDKFTGKIGIVIKYLTDIIESGHLKNGDKLEPERSIANKLMVSRSSVREAILHLSVLGYLRSIERSGTYVTSKYEDESNMNYNIHKIIEVSPIIDLMEIRVILELNNIDLVAKRYTINDINNLRKAIKKLEINKDNGIFEADLDFHLSLARATHNETIVKLMEVITEEVIKHKEYFLPTGPVSINHSIWTFSQIVNYIENNQSEKAKSLYREHFDLITGLIKNDNLQRK